MSLAVRPRILFLCTGNYYRSRFAERVFAARSEAEGLDWLPESRGLFEVPSPANVGFMSPHAVAALERLGIDPGPRDRFPVPVTADDLRRAARIVALDESEHRELLDARFPGWSDRVDFWWIPDVDRAPPAEALPLLEGQLHRLVDALLETSGGEVARLRRPSMDPAREEPIDPGSLARGDRPPGG